MTDKANPWPAAKENLFGGIPAELSEELFEQLAASENVTIERIISQGHVTPAGKWYDQERNEWVVLLAGGAAILFEQDNKRLTMRPGDFVNIPAHCRHRVEWTDPGQDTVWLAVHYL